MKTYYSLIFLSFLYLLVSSCETEININDANDTQDLVVHSLATPDSVVTVCLTNSYLYGQSYVMEEDGETQFIDNPNTYLSRVILNKAQVTLTAGDGSTHALAFNDKTMTYDSEYRPKAGEILKLDVVNNDGRKASATTAVPQKVELQFVSLEKVFNKSPMINQSYIDTYGEDSLAHITLKVKDPVGERNFYRLKARSTYIGEEQPSVTNDTFSSEDPIFYDSSLTSGYLWWPAYMSNIFSDDLFDGKDYTFTITVRPRKCIENEYSSMYGRKPVIILELQQITKDMYYYCKAWQRFRITNSSDFSENIYFPSNVTDGWGVFAAYNGSRVLL